MNKLTNLNTVQDERLSIAESIAALHPSTQVGRSSQPEQPTLAFFLSEEAKLRGIQFNAPRPGDAGFDVRCIEATSIEPHTFKLIRTGLHLAVPQGWVALMRDRSSVALRGAVVAGGVIDASYRGEVHVLIHNFGLETLRFELGERIAQCVVVPHLGTTLSVESVEDLGTTERGAAGFGSTGRL